LHGLARKLKPEGVTPRSVAISLHMGAGCIRVGSPVDIEALIKGSLISLLDGIKRADRESISAGMGRLDDLLEKGRGSLHPQLVHFLEKRSYPKALQFLGGDSAIPAGSCGGRR